MILPVDNVAFTASPASPQLAGTQVLFVGTASGGSGAIEYRFSQNVGGVLTVVRPYNTNPGWLWDTTGLALGTYNFQVDARSGGSASDSEASAVISFVISTPPVATSVSLFATPASPQPLETSVTFIGVGAGGSGLYEYQFSHRLAGTTTYTTGQAYGDNSVWTWNTTGATAGNHDILVSARSVGSTTEVSSTATYQLTGGTGPATNVGLVSTPAGPQTPGAQVTFTAVASGGSGTYEYQFYLWDGTSWTLMKDYTVPGNTWTWDTAGYAVRDYYVLAYARSAGSTVALDVQGITGYTLISTAPATGVTFTPPPSPASPQAPGAQVTFTAAASGGSGTYEYQFYLWDGTSWSLMKDYTVPGNTWTWNTAGYAVRTYYVLVYARSAGSTVALDTQTMTGYVLQ